MTREEMKYLQDLCRNLLRFKELKYYPELEISIRRLSKAKSTKKFESSRTYELIYKKFEDSLPDWDSFSETKFDNLKEKDIDDIKEMLYRESRLSLITYGDTFRFPGLINSATKDELISHIANTEMKDRNYELYETFIYELYLFKMEKILQDFLTEVDQSQLAIWNYEDGVSSYLTFRDAKYFEDYVQGDLIIIRDAVFGDHEDFSFNGNIQDFSEDVQLFLRLQ